MKRIATVMVLMILLCIPFAVADSMRNYEEYEPESPYTACVSKHAESSDLVDAMDNSVIGALESIAAISYTLCQGISAIDQVINTLASIIGMFEGNCCKIPLQIEECQKNEQRFDNWKKFYKPLQGFCCIVNCGWCTGQGCGKVGGMDMSRMSLGAIPNIAKPNTVEGVSEIDNKIGQSTPGIAQFHLSPYQNIYTAVGCMCPTAILFNLRKLKTIYQTYNCCVEQSCALGQSTEECEHYLDTATCMYWEGSLYQMLVNIAMSFAARFVGKLIPKVLLQNKMVSCLLALLDIWQTKDVFNGVKEAFEWTKATFDEPTCTDMGFANITDIRNAQRVLEENGKDVDQILTDKLEELQFRKSFYFGGEGRPRVKVEGERDVGYFVEMPKEELMKIPGIRAEDLKDAQGGTFVLAMSEDEVVKKYPELLKNRKIDFKTIDTTSLIPMLKDVNQQPGQLQKLLDALGPETVHEFAGAYIQSQKGNEQEESPEDMKLKLTISQYLEDNGVKRPDLYLKNIGRYSFDDYLRMEPILEKKAAVDRLDLQIDNTIATKGGPSLREFQGSYDNPEDIMSHIKGMRSSGELEKWLKKIETDEPENYRKVEDLVVVRADSAMDKIVGKLGSTGDPAGLFDKGYDQALKEEGFTLNQFLVLLQSRFTRTAYQARSPSDQQVLNNIIDNSNAIGSSREGIRNVLSGKDVPVLNLKEEIDDLKSKIAEEEKTLAGMSREDTWGDEGVWVARSWLGGVGMWALDQYDKIDTPDERDDDGKIVPRSETYIQSARDLKTSDEEYLAKKAKIDDMKKQLAEKESELANIDAETEAKVESLEREKAQLQAEIASEEASVGITGERTPFEFTDERMAQLEDFINSIQDERLKQKFKDFVAGVIGREEIEKEIMEAQKRAVMEKMKEYIIEQARYEIAYQLLSLTLGKFAYEMIEQKCEEDWESSEPENEVAQNYETPIVNPAQQDEDNKEQEICDVVGAHTSTTSRASKNGDDYDYSYSITACNQDLRYRVYMDGLDDLILHEGSLSKEETESQQNVFSSDKGYNRICITFSPGDVNPSDTRCSSFS